MNAGGRPEDATTTHSSGLTPHTKHWVLLQDLQLVIQQHPHLLLPPPVVPVAPVFPVAPVVQQLLLLQPPPLLIRLHHPYRPAQAYSR